MRRALTGWLVLCCGCLAIGAASALAQQSPGGELMLFPPSLTPMTGPPAAPTSQQPVGSPTRPGVTTDSVEPLPAAHRHATAPTAENAPPPPEREVSRHRRYARHWQRRGHPHYRYYAGGYAPSPANILSLPFVAVRHLLGQ